MKAVFDTAVCSITAEKAYTQSITVNWKIMAGESYAMKLIVNMKYCSDKIQFVSWYLVGNRMGKERITLLFYDVQLL